MKRKPAKPHTPFRWRLLLFAAVCFETFATFLTSWYFAASGSGSAVRFGRSFSWEDPAPFTGGQPFARHLRIDATKVSVERSWSIPNATFLSFWHGAPSADWQLPEFPSGLRVPRMPHDKAAWGWLDRTSELQLKYNGEHASITSPQPSTLPPGDEGREAAFGWPTLALSMGFHRPLDGDQPGPSRFYGTLNTPTWLWAKALPKWSVTSLPVQPVWSGFLFNVVFYAVCFAIPFIAISLWRRHLRFTRGRCPRCAYDLRHDFSRGCSECGWHKEHAFTNPDSDANPEPQTGSA